MSDLADCHARRETMGIHDQIGADSPVIEREILLRKKIRKCKMMLHGRKEEEELKKPNGKK